MVDYGKPLSFGISIDPTSTHFPEYLSLAQQADRAGLEYLAVQDHPYQATHLDALSLMTILADRTERISVVSDVLDLQLRAPTMLAKAASSVATMTGGRVQLGVGGGASAHGVAAMGGTPRSGRDMVAFTEQAIEILKRALRGGVVTSDTEHHQIAGYQAGPRPLQPIEVWVGSQMPRMLGVTGRVGEGWVCPLNIYVRPDEVPERQAIIDEAARRVGRDPQDIRRIYNVTGAIGAFRGGNGLIGPSDVWVETLSDWAVRLGFDTFIFWPATEPSAQVELFSTEIIPAVRRRVAGLRAQA